jgi:aminoglycoside/choline kinase family phosphotransferase
MTKKNVSKTAVRFVESLFAVSGEKLGLDVDKYRIDKLTGDASTRRYYRLDNSKKSFIACLSEPDETMDNFCEMQKILKAEDVDVPIIFDSNVDSGYLLQEDLGNTTLLKKNSSFKNFNEELSTYKKIVDQLVKVHSVDSSKYTKSCFYNRSFDKDKYNYEISFTKKYLVNGLLNSNSDDSFDDLIEDTFVNICDPLVKETFVLTHRDFHSRNVMVIEDRFSVIDFQDARMGIPQYDLVSLLEDCYYQLNIDNKNELKKYYWDNFIAKNKIQKSYDEYLKLYDYMTLQRTFKAMGSFAYIFKTRKDERYLKYIGYCFEKLRNILMKYPEFEEFRIKLSRRYYDH